MMTDCKQLAMIVQLIVPKVAMTVRMVISRQEATTTSFLPVDKKKKNK